MPNEHLIEDTVSFVHDPHAPFVIFSNLAKEHGLIKEAEDMDDRMMNFAAAIVERCANIGSFYSTDIGNAGDHIRIVLGELPRSEH